MALILNQKSLMQDIRRRLGFFLHLQSTIGSFSKNVKKDSDQFEAALVEELTERGIFSIPMTQSGKLDFVSMKSALKAWALEANNDPKAE